MGRTLGAVKRVVVLLAIWTVAGFLCVHTVSELKYHQSLNAEVSRLELERDQQSAQLTKMLVEENELRTNPQRKVEVLQQDFGFSRLDETPILILPDENN